MNNPDTESTSHTGAPAQTWDAAQYAANGRFVADLAGEALRLLDPRPGEAILDVGCGDGALTEKIAEAGASVTGCDADASMLAAAAERGLKTIVADMRSLPFHGEFDGVFSNAALHWVTDQQPVLRGIHQALRPGGRFVAEMGGHGNIAAIRVALQSATLQFSINAELDAASLYPSVPQYKQLLQQAGFRVDQITLHPRPTLLKTGMEQWLRVFRKGALARLNPEDQDKAVQHAVDLLRPILQDSDGNWWGDYVRLRFRAYRD